MILSDYLKTQHLNTRQSYTYDLRQFALWCWPTEMERGTFPKSIASLSDSLWLGLEADDLTAYETHMKDERKLKPATVARRLIAVTSLLKHAKKEGVYPAEEYERVMDRTAPAKKGFVSESHSEIAPDDQNRLLEAAARSPGIKGQRDYLALRLLLETGVRRFELLNLKVGNLAIEGGQPCINVEVAKRNESRRITLERETYNLIRQWLKEAGLKDDEDYIFCQVRKRGKGDKKRYVAIKSGRPLCLDFLNKLVKKLVTESGIEADSKITPHSFRVSAITDVLKGKAPLDHVQQVAGHKDTRMIVAIYNKHKHNKPISRYRRHKLFKPDEPKS